MASDASRSVKASDAPARSPDLTIRCGEEESGQRIGRQFYRHTLGVALVAGLRGSAIVKSALQIGFRLHGP